MQSLYPSVPTELSDDDLADLYAYPFERTWLRTNFVSSLDGATQGGDGKSGSLSSRADKRIFRLLRSLADIIVVGAATARVESYEPVRPTEARAVLRGRLGLAPVPAMAVVSRSLDLDPVLFGDEEAPTIVITTESSPADRRHELADVASVIVAGDTDVNFGVALEELVASGYRRMLCEGGPSVLRALVAGGHLDELCLTLSPLLVSGDQIRLTDGALLDPPRRLELRHLLEADGQLFARYVTRA